MTQQQQKLYNFLQQFEECITKDCEKDEETLQGDDEFLKDLHHVMNIVSTVDDETIKFCEPFDER